METHEILKLWEEVVNEAKFSTERGLEHYIKHIVEKDANKLSGVNVPDLTENEYRQLAHGLSSYAGSPMGSSHLNPVYGYETQGGLKIKYSFLDDRGTIMLVAYLGDDVLGSAITCYFTRYQNMLDKASPYRKLLPGEWDDKRYKCDLDGGVKRVKSIYTWSKKSS